ncbi:hypothetical protein ACHAXT_008273 [Thalassiosira profunda]
MAEQVQAILERMVPPLKDLRDRGLFSPDEIRSIVDRRRRAEYLLQRRSGARRSDYLRYIEDEVLLERLRKLRKERVLTELRNERIRQREEGGDDGSDDEAINKKHAYQTSGIGDSHIVSHVHLLYQRTLRKFHHPLDVLLNYAEFAKEHKSFRHLGKIYAEGLQRHPREAGLWIEAASFEYFGYVAQDYEKGDDVSSKVVGGSIRNARVLMQRGLRVNTTSREMWLQYFALELHYVQKLRGRREILELGLNEEGMTPSSEEEGSDEGDESAGGGDKLSASLLPAQIIFKNAVKAIPDDVRFRLRFVEACRQFPQTKQLEECIMESVTQDFGESVEGWVARISYADEEWQSSKSAKGGKVGFLAAADDEGSEEGNGTGSSEEEDGKEPPAKRARVESNQDDRDPALGLLREALKAAPKAKMYVEASRFLRSRIQRLLDEEQGEDVSHLIWQNEDAQGAARRHARVLEGLYGYANAERITSTTLTLDHADFLLSTGQPEKAEVLLKEACSSVSDADVALWLRWAEISQKMAAASLAPSTSPVRVLRRALKHTPISDRRGHELVSTELMRHLMLQPPSSKTSEELKELFQKLVLLSQGADYSLSNVKKSQHGADEEGEEESEEQANVASIFLAYLKYTLVNSGGDSEGRDSVRSIYSSVLFHSNFGKSCVGRSEEELVAMKAFFDLCIRYETTTQATIAPASNEIDASAKKTRKELKRARKMRLRKLYEAAIGFYEGGDSYWRKAVDEYQRGLDASKYG